MNEEIKYVIVMCLFMASDTIVDKNLTKEEADKKCEDYNTEESKYGDAGYRWYKVKQQDL